MVYFRYEIVNTLYKGKGRKVKQSRNRPSVAQRALEGGVVVNLTHRLPLPPGNIPGTHFR